MHLRALVVLSVVLTAGCATTTPRISHVHIGHAITGWVDTPEQRGLFVTAELEANALADEADMASKSRDLAGTKRHAHNMVHIVDPALEPTGPGTGYGFRRAIVESGQHIEYAAESPDASRNIQDAAKEFKVNQAVVVERGELILALAQSIISTDSQQEAGALAKETRTLAVNNLEGVDEDGNGTIGSTPREYGLRQLRADLVAAAEREDPPYRAVPQRFLFGLVRLPDGTWDFVDPAKSGQYGRY